MTIQFEHHLLDLLENNNCVIIPNFGGFINKDIPSQIQDAIIIPPSKQLAFNPYLKHDDDLLTGALMRAYKLTYEEAKNNVLQYSNEIQYALRKHQQFKINKIGSFKTNEKNQIVFQPFLQQVSSKSSYGLNTLHFQPLQKPIKTRIAAAKESKKEELKQLKKARREKLHSRKKRNKGALAGFIASFLLMAGVAGLMLTNTHMGTVNHQKAGFSNLIFPETTKHIDSFNNTKTSISNDGLEELRLTLSSPKETTYTISEQKLREGYYIVLGSYSTKENAVRLEQQLFSIGEDSYVVPAENGFYRVCKFASQNLLDAKNQLAHAKASSSKDLWLVKNSIR